MAQSSLNGARTPEKMTEVIFQNLAKNINKMAQYLEEHYDGHTNAFLATLDYVDGPVWAIQMYNQNVTQYIILEELADPGKPRLMYLCPCGLKPREITDFRQTWKRQIMRKGQVITQKSKIFYHSKHGICLKWENE